MSNANGHVLVTFSSIADAAGDCRTSNAQLQSQLEDLRSELAPMVQSWSGTAAEQYNALQAQWRRCAEDLSVILEDIARALDIAYDNYTTTERANASSWTM